MTEFRAITTEVDDLVVVGDIHGCYGELWSLLRTLPKGIHVCFVGDLIDRGPHSVDTLRWVKELVTLDPKHYSMVMGNHDWKAYRLLNLHRKVLVNEYLEAAIVEGMCARDTEFLGNVPNLIQFHLRGGGQVSVTHAGIPYEWSRMRQKHALHHTIYGETDGTVDEQGFPNRTYEWTESWENGEGRCVFGHTVVPDVTYYTENRQCINIDTGCVFGGSLTGFMPRTDTIFSVACLREGGYSNREPKPQGKS